jgi:N-acetylglucosamine-6-sulfatase
MSRRLVRPALAALLLAALVGAPSAMGATVVRHAPRPNIVLILTDDMRWDELENMPKTNALLAAQGITFSQSFVPNSLCCPSRVSTLTGQYSHDNGVWNSKAPYGGFKAFAYGYTRPDGVVVPPHEPHTIAVDLHNSGYRTGLIGKYMNQYAVKGQTTSAPRPGWDVWDAFVNTPKYFGYTLNRQGVLTTYGGTAADYSTDVLATDAVNFINTSPTTQPFFLEFTPYGPHAPFTPAPRYAKSLVKCRPTKVPPGCYRDYTSPNIAEADVSDKPAWVQAEPAGTGSNWNGIRRKQEQTLLAVDDAVQNVITALTDTGQLSNTLIVFTSDNSLSGGSHRWNNKMSPWDEALHVPLIVRYDPLTAARAGTVNATDEPLNVDFAPTFADLAGVTPPTGPWAYDGESIVPALSGTGSLQRHYFPLEHLMGGIEGGDGLDVPSYCGVRTDNYAPIAGSWMYVRYSTGEQELYDLVADPWELNSQHANPAYATQLQALKTLDQQTCVPTPPGFSWGP